VNSEQPFDAADNAADDFENDGAVEQPAQEDETAFEADMEDEHEERGRVKFFNGHKGFGFIKAEDEEEYFVHISDVRENLELVFVVRSCVQHSVENLHVIVSKNRRLTVIA